MGNVNLNLEDEYEDKLRKLAEKHRRTLKGQVEHLLDKVQEE